MGGVLLALDLDCEMVKYMDELEDAIRRTKAWEGLNLWSKIWRVEPKPSWHEDRLIVLWLRRFEEASD